MQCSAIDATMKLYYFGLNFQGVRTTRGNFHIFMHSFDKHLGLALGAVLLQNGQQHLLVHFVDLQFSGLVIRSLPVKKKH